MPTASVFVNVADALETELGNVQFRSGESLTLYTSYCTSVNTTFPIRFYAAMLVINVKNLSV